jgi:hypothetical protein
MNELSDRFLDKDETLYAEKVDSAGANAGFKRIEIKVYVKSQRVDFVRVYFTRNAKADSSDIQVGNRSGVFGKVIEDMPAFEYLFSLVSFDKYGNRSLPYELSGRVVGDNFRDMLVNRPLSNVNISGANITVEWGGSPSYALWSELTYINTSGQTVTLIVPAEETSTAITDFGGGRPKYATLFLPGENSIDTLRVDASNLIIFREQSILAANGVTATTDALINGVTSLTYPVHCSSLRDLAYFTNLRELDLTGGTLFPTPEYTYERNDAVSVIGNIPWTPLLSNVNNDMPASDYQALKDMLETGVLTKVKYSPNSIAGLDAILEPYVGSTVELLPLPDEVYIPNQYFVDGVMCDINWKVEYIFPAPNPPAGEGLRDIYQITPVNPSASIMFALPKEYKYNVREYPYLKFKVYMPPEESINDYFQLLYPRFMNYWWNAPASDSNFGQEYWAPNYIWMTEFQEWIDITVPLNDALNMHNRVIVINIGYEQGTTPNPDMIYYFANFRLSKTD